MQTESNRSNCSREQFPLDGSNGVQIRDKELELSFKDLFTIIPKRLVALLGKLIGVKMFILYGATVLFLKVDRFPWYAWIVIAVVVIFGREALKYLRDIKG